MNPHDLDPVIEQDASSRLFTLKVFSAAEILALFTTPLQLVPAAGANTIVMPYRFILWYQHKTTAYGGISPLENLCASHETVGTPLFLCETQGFLDQAASASRDVLSSADTVQSVEAGINENLMLCIQNGNITTGDGVLAIKTMYRVIDVSILKHMTA